VRRPRTRKAASFAGAFGALAIGIVSGASAAGPADTLQSQVAGLQAQAQHALLDLYALDSRLHSAQNRLNGLEAQAASIQREEELLTRELSATRRTLTTSRRLLATNLRVLYKQDDVSPLAVVLGAQSLDEAVTKLDALSRVADQSRQIVAVTSSAQTRVLTLRSTLQAQRVRVDADIAAARTTTQMLATARADRLGFISALHRRQHLKAEQIVALQQVAQHVEQKSNAIQAASAVTPVPASAVPAPTAGRTLTVSSTGYSLPGHTATGIPVGFGVVAVDPSVIPLGTRLTIPGYGEGVAADTGSAVRGADIDLWFPTLAQATAWGRRTLTITLH
jgi:3D (Asp-Asp-Asp) domain-containing protein